MNHFDGPLFHRCHTCVSVAGIHPKGNQDGFPIKNVGNDGDGEGLPINIVGNNGEDDLQSNADSSQSQGRGNEVAFQP
jgi:hypothetical protein